MEQDSDDEPADRRHRDAMGALPLNEGEKKAKTKKSEKSEKTKKSEKSEKPKDKKQEEKERKQRRHDRIMNELVGVVEEHATAPLLKHLKLGPLAEFRIAKKLVKCEVDTYILDHKSANYESFLKYCKENHCQDYLLCFTHFKKMIDKKSNDFDDFMLYFNEGLEKFLTHTSNHSVSLGDNHAVHLAALKKCFNKCWKDGKPEMPP